ncbi:MAG TPA: S9 family peptidase [Rudaea sp.]|nr:S9 family peptidase [Rudaea sp.]
MIRMFAIAAAFAAVHASAVPPPPQSNPPAALSHPAVVPAPPAGRQKGLPEHPFDVRDLVMMDRISDPQVSPDGKWVAYQLRQTDYANNKGVTSVWVQSLDAKDAKPRRLGGRDLASAASPRWSPDSRYVYFLAKPVNGTTMEVQRLAVDAKPDAEPELVAPYAADINNFKLSPDGRQMLISVDVFPACAEAFCTTKPEGKEINQTPKTSGTLYDKLFIRHWDTWADGKRSQLYIVDIDVDAARKSALPRPRLLSVGIDGDVPSKPFGDESEYAFSPDGRTVYFSVRIAGTTEPWSTNFDIYSVPADGSAAPRNLTAANKAWDTAPVPGAEGKTLYYLAMKRPGFEADRYAVMALDLATGKTREIDPGWDRSPGGLQLSKNGKVLYATADDEGDHPLFAIDVADGKVKRLTGPGQVEGFSAVGDRIVYAQSTLKAPADLYSMPSTGGKAAPITNVNAERLAKIRMGDYEFFTFKGAQDDTVQGYVVKPVDFQAGRKYPVAFIVHGGPQGAMTNEFHYRWNPQTYAGYGFAVVTINFHGSTGYGQAFTDAISGDWGDKPLEDLKKGWDAALAKYDFLDRKRACALGASYGGYMIYWMAGNWNSPWRCFVDHDGVFDNRMMAYSTEELWFSEWENGRSTQWEHPENYEKFNPIDYVKNWHVPMLVIHSANDFRIPIEQGIAAFTALQRRGIPSEFLTFQDENHWVLKPQNSVLWHDTVNQWLLKWTAPAP